MNKTDVFICHTQKAKKSIETEGFGKKRIEVIPLGIDLNRFKPSNKSNKPHKTVLFVGRLVEEKGILDLYEAFKNYLNLKKDKKLRLLIVGEGPLKKELTNKIITDKLKNYITIEQSSYDLIHKIYQKTDLFVFPSKTTKTWEEQYGMALLEALGVGLPIIAYNSGSIKEILQNTNILVKEGNIKDLTHSIKRLIENQRLLYKMSKVSRKLAEKRYNCNDYKNKITSIYKSLL